MRHGILAILLILCGLLPRTASAVPMDYYFALTLAANSTNDIIGVNGALFEYFGHIDPDVNNNDFFLGTTTRWYAPADTLRITGSSNGYDGDYGVSGPAQMLLTPTSVTLPEWLVFLDDDLLFWPAPMIFQLDHAFPVDLNQFGRILPFEFEPINVVGASVSQIELFGPAQTSSGYDIVTATGWARAQGVPEPTALSLFAGALLLMWAAARRRTSTRIDING